MKTLFSILSFVSLLSALALLVAIAVVPLVPVAIAANLSQAQLEDITQQWQGSAHALAGVNCTSCHQEKEAKAFVAQPTHESCQSCHQVAVETFLFGKHGVRTGEGLSPLAPAMAHLPMKETAMTQSMSCNTCHDVHSVNTVQAAVESCLSCHNDTHSLNYAQSKHGMLFAEVAAALPRPNAESVTCATCHLPRQEMNGTVFVNHNNTFTLLPRDRMVKEVCMRCHGMEYAYNSIFDDGLVESDFDRPPTQQLKTLDMVRTQKDKRTTK